MTAISSAREFVNYHTLGTVPFGHHSLCFTPKKYSNTEKYIIKPESESET
jgi:hypothetical protein